MTILKPLHGTEPRLFGRLSSFCIQSYQGPIQLVFGIRESSDAVVDVVNRLRTVFPEKSIDLQIDSQDYGANRKVSNLANMMRAARHDVLIVADSDIQVDRRYLADVVAELQNPGVGAVTCLYHGVAGAGVWSRLSALAINTHFLPQVVMALSFGLAAPCFGATIALRRRTLATIGGFSAFADFLAEDYAMGEAIRASGYRVVVSDWSVGHVCLESDCGSLLARQMRFARTIRSIDPIGFAGSIITHPFPLALLAGLLGGFGWPFPAVLALACRLMACMSVEKAFGLPRQHYWLIPVQDVVSFMVYVLSFFGATVDWRGHRYRLLSNGSLVQIEK